MRSSIRQSVRRPVQSVEKLESRRLFTAHMTSITADNRGELLITFSAPLDPATINQGSVQMYTPGVDGVFGTSDDVKMIGHARATGSGNNRIRYITDTLPANASYLVKVVSRRARAADGSRIDGEFNGAGLAGGDGVAGGDLLFVAKRDKGINPVARMSTSLGAINVKLFRDQTPITVDNFRVYADTGAWDGTFFHRNAHIGPPTLPTDEAFVIQGGGFKVNSNNTLGIVPHNPPITNEPGIGNTRGTISMAKIGVANPPEFPSAENSATNQFFFNERDNRGAPPSLDSQNGGFTVFGTIVGASGLAVMDAIGGLTNKDLRSGDQSDPNNPTQAMDDTPVLNPSTTAATLNPAADLVVIRRVALINKITGFVAPA
jgi:cyclophilin family peptidyl-prolyl cis-trans isomerase